MLAGRKGILYLGLAALLAGTVGCGGDNRGAVSGQVTLDGQPVDGGEIRFLPPVGIPASAEIAKGQYAISAATGPSPGTARVEIRWSRKTGRRIPAIAPAPRGTVEEIMEAIPARYNSQSELQVDVKPGANQFDFALHSR